MKPGIGHNNPPPDRFCPECGFVLEKRKKPRSTPQHRRLFGLLRKAFEHWPHGAPYSPRTEEELRAYLLIKAGWYEHRTQIGKGPHFTPDRSITIDMDGVRHVYTPKSIAYDAMTHQEACRVFAAIDEIVTDVIGVPADQLLREHAA